MQLILFSSPDKFRSEIYILIKMFENGLDFLHIKKPDFSKKQFKNYIELIPKKYHKHIVIHSNYRLAFKYNIKGIHLSKSYLKKSPFSKIMIGFLKFYKPNLHYSCTCHNLNGLLNLEKSYKYVFLSPLFDNEGILNQKFTKGSIKSTLSQINVKIYALGGIKPIHTNELYLMNFNGLSLLGSVWYSNEQPLEVYYEVKNKIKSLNNLTVLDH